MKKSGSILFLTCGIVAGIAIHAGFSKSGEARTGPSTPRPAEGETREMPARTRVSERVEAATTEVVPLELRKEFANQKLGHEKARQGEDAFIEALNGIDDLSERDAFIRGGFAWFGTLGLEPALSAAAGLPEGSPKDAALLALLCQWSGRPLANLLADPGLWEERPPSLSGKQEHSRGDAGTALGTWMLTEGFSTPAQVVTYARDFLDSDGIDYLVTEAALAVASANPDQALAMIAGFPELQGAVLRIRFFDRWAREDPFAAWKWGRQNPGNPEAQSLLGTVSLTLGERDPEAAAAKIGGLEGLEGVARQTAYQVLGQNWAKQDGRAAVAWAQALTNAEDRDRALAGVKRQVPAGVGFGLSRRQDGVKIVGGIVDDGPASRTSLSQGDRLLAVTGQDGAWLAAADMNDSQFVTACRGEPGTQVSLQVESKDGSRRVVTVTRDYLFDSPAPRPAGKQ